MTINKKELTKLSPEERIKRLKLMEEERKKDVNEIGELIKKSMQELRTDKLAEEVAPEQRSVDISRLFETTGEQKLERTAREESPATALIRGTRGYLTVNQINYDYSRLKRFDSQLSMRGSLTEEEKRLVGEIGERLNIAEKYMPEGEKAASKLDAGRAVLYKLKRESGID